jgi:glucose/arabinose dehydrogenase
MRSLGLLKLLFAVAATVGTLSIVDSITADPAHSTSGSAAADSACAGDDSGLQLPPGFCATVFADGIGHARQMVVAPNGVLYVNTWSGDYFPPGEKAHEGGFLVALQDKSGSGKADVIERFGATIQTGAGGSGIDLYNGALYAELNDRIVKYELPAGSLVPTGSAVTVVSGLPLGGDHPMHPFLIGPDGSLYVDVATATNACQLKNRQLKSPGADPCTELETRGGVWRYDAKKTDQKFSPAERYATGIRNAEGFGYDSAGKMLYVTQHGRDQLHANWPDFYPPEQEATLPSEEVVLLKKGGDYGWPECYYDPWQQKLMLAPEYGGDGHKVGVCASKTAPAAAFPAHWGPNAMTLYDKTQFPARYRGGLFIALSARRL